MTLRKGIVDRGDPAAPGEGVTLDRPFLGRVKIYQPNKGYRYSIDAFLLTHFALNLIADFKRADIVVAELGSGAGVVSLGMALSEDVRHVTGIEIVPELVDMSRRSAALSGLEDKVSFVEGDLKNPAEAGIEHDAFDLVLSNPPYRPVGEGRISPDFAKAVARHELAANVGDVARCASRLLKSEGSLCVVYIPERLPELILQLREAGLVPRRMKLVHPRASDPAKMALLEARKSSAKSFLVEPPLFVHNENGDYTAEMEAAFEGPQ